MAEEKNKLTQWYEAGGSLKTSWRKRRNSPELFPYMNARALREGFNPAAVTAIVAMVVLIAVYARWSYKSMSGSVFARPERKGIAVVVPTMGQVATATPEATNPPITPFSVERPDIGLSYIQPTPTATNTPVVSRTAAGTKTVINTPTPTPTPTATRYYVAVKVRFLAYWPDDGPDWCADYDETTGVCMSNTTSGRDWRDLEMLGAACPETWLGAYIEDFWCVDTGASAVCEGDTCTVLVLSQIPLDITQEAKLYIVR